MKKLVLVALLLGLVPAALARHDPAVTSDGGTFSVQTTEQVWVEASGTWDGATVTWERQDGEGNWAAIPDVTSCIADCAKVIVLPVRTPTSVRALVSDSDTSTSLLIEIRP